MSNTIAWMAAACRAAIPFDNRRYPCITAVVYAFPAMAPFPEKKSTSDSDKRRGSLLNGLKRHMQCTCHPAQCNRPRTLVHRFYSRDFAGRNASERRANLERSMRRPTRQPYRGRLHEQLRGSLRQPKGRLQVWSGCLNVRAPRRANGASWPEPGTRLLMLASVIRRPCT